MAVSYVASSSGYSSVANFTPTFPTGTTTGDVVYLITDTGTNGFPTPPTGWTVIRKGNYSGENNATTWPEGQVMRRVIQAGDVAPTVTAPLRTIWAMVTFRGEDTTTPEADSGFQATNTSSTSAVAPSVNAAIPGSYLLSCFGAYTTHTGTPPAGQTELVDRGDYDSMFVNIEALAGTGATGTRTETLNSADQYKWGISVVIQPLPGPQPPGIATAEAFGSPSISVGPVSVSATAVASAEAFGADSLVLGPVSVSPVGIASGEAFGATGVGWYLFPPGIASGEAFGIAKTAISVIPVGIASAEVFGAIRGIGRLIVLDGAAIASTEAFGLDRIVESLAPVGIPGAEAVGVPKVPLGLGVVGIQSGEVFGLVTIQIVSPPVYCVRAGFGVWYSGTDSDGTYRWGPLETAFGFRAQADATAQAAALSSRSAGLVAAPIVVFLPQTFVEDAPASYDELIELGVLVGP